MVAGSVRTEGHGHKKGASHAQEEEQEESQEEAQEKGHQEAEKEKAQAVKLTSPGEI